MVSLHSLDINDANINLTTHNYLNDIKEIEQGLNQLDITEEEIVNFIKETLVEFWALLPSLNHTSFLHGDLKVQNLLIGNQSKNLVCIYDYEFAEIGNPHSDFKLIYKLRYFDFLEGIVQCYNTKSKYQIDLRTLVVLSGVHHIKNGYLKHFGKNEEVFIKAREKLLKYMNEKDIYV